MITPEQQQAAQSMLKQVGYTPPVSRVVLRVGIRRSWRPNLPCAPDTTTQPMNNLFGNGQNNTENFAGVDTVNNAASGILNAITGGVQTFGHALSTINLKNISLFTDYGMRLIRKKINAQDRGEQGTSLRRSIIKPIQRKETKCSWRTTRYGVGNNPLPQVT